MTRSLACPLCGRSVAGDDRLRRHLTGQTRYNGHELPHEEAEGLLRAAEPTNSRPPPTSADVRSAEPIKPAVVRPRTPSHEGESSYLQEVFERLVEFKQLPKYQFERRVDAFLVGFLPDLLEGLLGGQVTAVVPEFPLKKPGSNLSTNVDHVFFQRHARSADSRWLLLELKTDMTSVKQAQISTYQHYAGLGMERLLADVATIKGASVKAQSYGRLLEYFRDYDASRPIEIVYLSPALVPGLPRSGPFRNITFAELRHLPVRQHQAAWDLFRDLVLPALTSD